MSPTSYRTAPPRGEGPDYRPSRPDGNRHEILVVRHVEHDLADRLVRSEALRRQVRVVEGEDRVDNGLDSAILERRQYLGDDRGRDLPSFFGGTDAERRADDVQAPEQELVQVDRRRRPTEPTDVHDRAEQPRRREQFREEVSADVIQRDVDTNRIGRPPTASSRRSLVVSMSSSTPASRTASIFDGDVVVAITIDAPSAFAS